MRAYVNKLVNGTTRIGSSHCSITKEYKTQANLIRYGVLPLLQAGETAEVDIHFDWDERYGNPNKTVTVDSLGSFLSTRNW
jgi:hypothetical protein